MSKDFAALIDRERLREAIGHARERNEQGFEAWWDDVVIAAAEAYLATLEPPTREPVTVYDLSARGVGLVPFDRAADSRSDCEEFACSCIREGYTHIVITERVLL